MLKSLLYGVAEGRQGVLPFLFLNLGHVLDMLCLIRILRTQSIPRNMLADLSGVTLQHFIAGQAEPALFGCACILNSLVIAIERRHEDRQLLIEVNEALFRVLDIGLATEIEFQLFHLVLESTKLLLVIATTGHLPFEVSDGIDQLGAQVV